jgi:hypothetical protein
MEQGRQESAFLLPQGQKMLILLPQCKFETSGAGLNPEQK